MNETASLPADILKRKGANKAADIPQNVLELLNQGLIESVNLTEWLAVDHRALLSIVLNTSGLSHEAEVMLPALNKLKEDKPMKMIPAIAAQWNRLLSELPETGRGQLFAMLASHRSDSVRCWAAYIVGVTPNMDIAGILQHIRPFAADSHFGVREIAWMAVRAHISANLEAAITLLAKWVRDEDANIRRFAVESTRPQGVWAKHIQALKENPTQGLPLLEPLRSDPVKYVQDSVANWLNDTSKSQPDWVLQLCSDWLESSDTKETKRITERAQRTLTRK
ncbi:MULTISPECIES: DNA alkylation repair protein [unclassified Paenibacillus]|uniref:DNA alkylation repair protein n=1 Tax=unclassified Paenibacillus TaxID=185978 RepID=UPI0030F62FD2